MKPERTKDIERAAHKWIGRWKQGGRYEFMTCEFCGAERRWTFGHHVAAYRTCANDKWTKVRPGCTALCVDCPTPVQCTHLGCEDWTPKPFSRLLLQRPKDGMQKDYDEEREHGWGVK